MLTDAEINKKDGTSYLLPLKLTTDSMKVFIQVTEMKETKSPTDSPIQSHQSLF